MHDGEEAGTNPDTEVKCEIVKIELLFEEEAKQREEQTAAAKVGDVGVMSCGLHVFNAFQRFNRCCCVASCR